ncbi:histidine kinase [Tamlana sp. 2201CG12-4]|uniref:sensor histidine kinase n=1 Tax=Tamlana sp. 2201CG12-4 TaxID=3112582 RepID=UPI002DBBCB08|nr:histidine kinase [Tamlana sp. 2201CG12-4]MEC3906686.1 histidine kinase [Tamlana sp. 2201CG12-4]
MNINKVLAVKSFKTLKNIFPFSKKLPLTIPVKYHVIFWLGYFLFNFVRWGSYFDDYWYSLKSNLVEFPIHIIIVYINIYYLIPKFVLKKKYLYYVLSLAFMLAMVYLVRTGLNYLLVTEEIWPEAEDSAKFLELNHFIAVILGELYVIAFATSIKLLIDWSVEKRRNEDLAKLQMSTELKYLRTQIQPHFFFNTLNNLYALTLQKSDNASLLVIKLSDMMQYILYEIKSSKANLLEEINHINNFIDIERLRFENRVEAEVNITGNIEDISVPPLLLLSFVENCFKHGMKGNDKLEINMSFEIQNNEYLEFTITNNFNPDVVKEKSRGIGNDNAKRRLKLLFFNNFILDSKIEGETYKLFLKIPV